MMPMLPPRVIGRSMTTPKQGQGGFSTGNKLKTIKYEKNDDLEYELPFIQKLKKERKPLSERTACTYNSIPKGGSGRFLFLMPFSIHFEVKIQVQTVYQVLKKKDTFRCLYMHVKQESVFVKCGMPPLHVNSVQRCIILFDPHKLDL